MNIFEKSDIFFPKGILRKKKSYYILQNTLHETTKVK